MAVGKMLALVREISRKYSVIYHKSMFRNNMKAKIKDAAVPIAELSDSEKQEIFAFWNKKYGITPDINTFKWYYSVNGIKDRRYISEDVYFNYIWTTLNDMKRCRGLNDKNLLDLFYCGERMPKTVFHNINGVFLDHDYRLLSRANAVALAEKLDKVVIKPAVDSAQGNNVLCIKGSECEQYLDSMGKDYIVQELVIQHPSFAVLNDSSVNVIRMTSLLLNDDVHILDSIIRVGAPGNFTDHKNIAIGVESDGRLKDFGVTVAGKKVDTLPNGVKFGGMQLAGYEEMKNLAKMLHVRTPQARLIGWDLTVDSDGMPLIIEANIDFPGIGRGQDCNGPFFGEYTDDVMQFVLRNKKNRV